MTQAKIREQILEIVRGELAWADPMSKVCLDQHERHPKSFHLVQLFNQPKKYWMTLFLA